MTTPLIALINATPAAIGPARSAVRDELPTAVVWSILDDRLQQEAVHDGQVTDRLVERMRRLVGHAVAEGADAVLLTCSLYGFTADQLSSETGVPVLAPDDAAFAAVLSGGYDTVLVVGSVHEALAESSARLATAAEAAGRSLTIEGAVAEAAYEASLRGDRSAILEALAIAVADAPAADAVLLAQYSLSPVAEDLAARSGVPVLAGPVSAATALREQLSGGAE